MTTNAVSLDQLKFKTGNAWNGLDEIRLYNGTDALYCKEGVTTGLLMQDNKIKIVSVTWNNGVPAVGTMKGYISSDGNYHLWDSTLNSGAGGDTTSLSSLWDSASSHDTSINSLNSTVASHSTSINNLDAGKVNMGTGMNGWLGQYNGAKQLWGLTAKCPNSNNTASYNKTFGLVIENDGLFLYDNANNVIKWQISAYDHLIIQHQATNLDNENYGYFWFDANNCANKPSNITAGTWTGFTICTPNQVIRTQIIFLSDAIYIRRRDGAGWQSWKLIN